MAVEYVTIPITGDVTGNNYYKGNQEDTQIVTFTDGGDLNGKTIKISGFGKSAATEPGHGPGGDDWFNIDLSKFNDNFAMEAKSLQAGDTFQITGWDSREFVGTKVIYSYTGSDGLKHQFTFDQRVTNSNEDVRIVCFAGGTRISVRGGTRLIDDLSQGDLVLCGDGKERPIRWIGQRHLTAASLATSPHLRPVMLRTDALAPGCPSADLMLSPQHRVLVEGWQTELLFGEPGVLVAAKHLVNDQSIRTVEPKNGVTYYHILLDTHETVLANDLPAETLFPAVMTTHALDSESRQEIIDLFPDIAVNFASYGPPLARSIKAHEAAVLTRLQ